MTCQRCCLIEPFKLIFMFAKLHASQWKIQVREQSTCYALLHKIKEPPSQMYHRRIWAGYGTNGYSVQLWADINRECPTFFVFRRPLGQDFLCGNTEATKALQLVYIWDISSPFGNPSFSNFHHKPQILQDNPAKRKMRFWQSIMPS